MVAQLLVLLPYFSQDGGMNGARMNSHAFRKYYCILPSICNEGMIDHSLIEVERLSGMFSGVIGLIVYWRNF